MRHQRKRLWRGEFAGRWVALALSLLAAPAAAQQLAFPTAGGAGGYASGGRGGDVYKVTSLLDDGSAGTLRYGIENATGPRTIIFDVGGVIDLQSTLAIDNDDLTIAGQSAPGDGVALHGYPTSINNASNVILQHMRFRTGDRNAVGNAGGNGDLIGAAADALNVFGSDNVIVDHVSTSWSMDETLSVTNSTNVTVQYSIIAESLDDSFHDKGPHGYGSILDAVPNSTISYHHNLLAHHRSRMPRMGTFQDEDDPSHGSGYKLDIRNNVIYNWGSAEGPYSVEADDEYTANFVGNTMINGPDSDGNNDTFRFFSSSGFPDQPDSDIYVDDNLVDGADIDDNFFYGGGGYNRLSSEAAMDGAPVATDPSLLTESIVLDYAGALARTTRDVVDGRIVDSVRNRTGSIIDSQSDVGGYPTLNGGTALSDSDGDGMPDTYETNRGFNPNDASDRNGDANGDGWTNLENYLHTLADPHIFQPQAYTEDTFTATHDAMIQGFRDSDSNPDPPYDADNRDVNYGSNDTLNARESPTGNTIRMSKSYVRFDLPGLLDTAVSASAEFYWDRTDRGGLTYFMYGLLESASYEAGDLDEMWDEADLDWLNAPGNFDDGLAGGFDPNHAVLLGQFTSPDSPGWVSVSGQDLLDLINADTNGTITLMIGAAESNGVGLGSFQSTENAAGNGPRLNMLYNEIPEPTSVGLLTLGGLVIVARRRRPR